MKFHFSNLTRSHYALFFIETSLVSAASFAFVISIVQRFH